MHAAADPELCPLHAVQAWLDHLRLRYVTTGPLFQRIDLHGNIGGHASGRGGPSGRMSPSSVNRILQRCAAAADVSPTAPCGVQHFTGHSLRRGGATAMVRSGADPLQVSRHGRWRDGSPCFHGYGASPHGGNRPPGDGGAPWQAQLLSRPVRLWGTR